MILRLNFNTKMRSMKDLASQDFQILVKDQVIVISNAQAFIPKI